MFQAKGPGCAKALRQDMPGKVIVEGVVGPL